MHFVTKGLSCITGKKARIKNGIHCVIGIVRPNGIVAAHGGLFHGRHCSSLAGVNVGVDGSGTHAKLIVVVPSGVRARADIGEGTFVFSTHQSLSITSAISPVARLAAVTHGIEILVLIGQIGNIADGEARTRPAGLAAMSGVVGKADSRA